MKDIRQKKVQSKYCTQKNRWNKFFSQYSQKSLGYRSTGMQNLIKHFQKNNLNNLRQMGLNKTRNQSHKNHKNLYCRCKNLELDRLYKKCWKDNKSIQEYKSNIQIHLDRNNSHKGFSKEDTRLMNLGLLVSRKNHFDNHIKEAYGQPPCNLLNNSLENLHSLYTFINILFF